MTGAVPHLRVIVTFSLLAVVGYALFSIWVFGWTDDAALRGDVAGTWKSFAVLAFGFWLGSSSGGKAAANPTEPQPVVVQQPPNQPVPTTDIPIPEPAFARFEGNPPSKPDHPPGQPGSRYL